MAGCSPPLFHIDPDQLCSSTRNSNPSKPGSATRPRRPPLHARIHRAVRQLILDGALEAGRPCPPRARWPGRWACRATRWRRPTASCMWRASSCGAWAAASVRAGAVRARTRRGPARQPAEGGAAPEPARQRHVPGRRRARIPGPRAFAPGVPETRSFPLPTWERLTRQVLRIWRPGAAAQPAAGHGTLRWAIADYVNLERGARATPERVLVLTSSQQALTLCATVLLDAGEQICIEDPVITGAQGLRRRRAGMRARAAGRGRHAGGTAGRSGPVGAGRVSDALAPVPHRRHAGAGTPAGGDRLARRRQAWIIEDDYDSEFHYAGKPTACVQGLDPQERTIYIGTFTKSLFPGLRIGYMVLPAALVAPMTAARTLLDGHSAPIPQLTLARFIDGGHFGARAHHACRLRRTARRAGAAGGPAPSHWLQARVPAGGMQMPCVLAPGRPSARRWTRRGGKG